jgi:hypothetical protein
MPLLLLVESLSVYIVVVPFLLSLLLFKLALYPYLIELKISLSVSICKVKINCSFSLRTGTDIFVWVNKNFDNYSTFENAGAQNSSSLKKTASIVPV